MKQPLDSLPSNLREEYLRRDGALFQSRVRLYCLITTGLFFAVSGQYWFRAVFLRMHEFRPAEMWLWVLLLTGSVFCIWLNRQCRCRENSKRVAILYAIVFLSSLAGLSSVYPENNLVFVFYFGFALIFTATLIPWHLSEILGLAALYATAFLIAHYNVVLFSHYQAPVLPRFRLPWDGLVFLSIATFISYLVRRKEIERDVHNFVLLKRVESQNLQIDKELDFARRVHRTLVPASFSHEKADIWVSYIPVSYVSGDYARFRFLDENRLTVFISDVTGHGVAAALLVNRLHTEFERLSLHKLEPAQLLRQLNDFISSDFEGTEMYLSAFCGLFDFERSEFRYCNYGHPSQFWYHVQREEIRHLESHDTLLGIRLERDSYAEGLLEFDPGDRLLLFTDGVIETTDPLGEAFGEARLKEFLKQNDALADGRFNDLLLQDLARFRGGEFNDDIFLLNIKTKVAGRSGRHGKAVEGLRTVLESR